MLDGALSRPLLSTVVMEKVIKPLIKSALHVRFVAVGWLEAQSKLPLRYTRCSLIVSVDVLVSQVKVKAWLPLVSGSGGELGGVVSSVTVNGKDAECGLSEPSLKRAVRVKLVESCSRDTEQSMLVARGFWVSQAKPPSLYSR